jgi:hypothetical protein
MMLKFIILYIYNKNLYKVPSCNIKIVSHIHITGRDTKNIYEIFD